MHNTSTGMIFVKTDRVVLLGALWPERSGPSALCLQGSMIQPFLATTVDHTPQSCIKGGCRKVAVFLWLQLPPLSCFCYEDGCNFAFPDVLIFCNIEGHAGTMSFQGWCDQWSSGICYVALKCFQLLWIDFRQKKAVQAAFLTCLPSRCIVLMA